MRPQFASSPAIAVLTSGEFATAIAIRLADLPDTAPVTSMRTSFCAPSPSRTTCSARSSSSESSASRKPRTSLVSCLPTRTCSAWPVANSSTVSLVEVSESTVVQLKLRLTPRDSMSCSRTAGSFASVNTKHSMVAMSGATMPLPLAKPLMRTGAPPICATRVAPLGKVSVVMMPRAAASQPSVVSAECSAGRAAVSRACGSTSPITPVLATNTSCLSQPDRSAAARAVASTASAPAWPVNTLALPAFTTSVRARPPARLSRHQSTGAPGQRLRVNTPATCVPGGISTMTRSVRS